MSGRMIVDKAVKVVLFASAIISILIVLAIGFFIFRESLDAWAKIGISEMLFKSVWRPGQDQYGILAMIVGSVSFWCNFDGSSAGFGLRNFPG